MVDQAVSGDERASRPGRLVIKFGVRLVLLAVMAAALISCNGENQAAKEGRSGTRTASAAPNSAAGGEVARPIYRTLTPREAEALIKSRADLKVIDVRSPAELKNGFIKGSRLVPFMDIARGRRTLPDQPMLLVCAVGGRSLGIAKFYAGRKYREVYNLKGGISAWKEAGLPLEYPAK